MDHLCGKATKAEFALGWTPKMLADVLCRRMVAYDLTLAWDESDKNADLTTTAP